VGGPWPQPPVVELTFWVRGVKIKKKIEKLLLFGAYVNTREGF
jgi:hypothetical protein